jgi:hypothetical protein
VDRSSDLAAPSRQAEMGNKVTYCYLSLSPSAL